MPKYPVARVDEIPPGERTIVDLGGRSIGVFNVAGRFFALRNRCPHQAGPLCEGPVLGLLESSCPGEYNHDTDALFVRCPWHGWEFDVTTGRSWFNPERVRVKTYRVSLEKASSQSAGPGPPARLGLQPGPFRAESYPVSEEDGVVVVHIGS